jgi:hypothetical protein
MSIQSENWCALTLYLSMNLAWERRRPAGLFCSSTWKRRLAGAPSGASPIMVPMHGKHAEGAFHEPHEFRVRAPIESGGGPPHSKTL